MQESQYFQKPTSCPFCCIGSHLRITIFIRCLVYEICAWCLKSKCRKCLVKSWKHDIGNQTIILSFSRTMPDIETLMQEWPGEFEDLLNKVGLPTADIDSTLEQYVEMICSILDIPIYQSKIQSLHVLFTLFSEFKNSQVSRFDYRFHRNTVSNNYVTRSREMSRMSAIFNIIHLHISNPTLWSIPHYNPTSGSEMSNSLNFKTM